MTELKNQITEVKDSGIHGRGLFAKEDIKVDTIIGELDCQPTKEDGPHVLWVQDEHGVETGVTVSCVLKYINHSDEPNVAYYDDLTVGTIRDIKAGEELFHYYGDHFGIE